MSSAKRRPFSLGLSVLTIYVHKELHVFVAAILYFAIHLFHIVNHIHILQVTSQLNCGNTSQI